MKKATMQEKISLMNTAAGAEKADRVILGGTLVNVYTLEIYPADVAIRNGRIVCVGDVSHTIGNNTDVVDAKGLYLAPGFIDGHLHIGGTHMSMTEYGKLSLIHGGTALAADFFEIAIIQSLRGIRAFLEELKATGVKPLFVIPMSAFHQNESFENTGTFTEEMALEALEWPDCCGVNEVNLSRVAAQNPAVLRIVDRAQQLGKTLVGHASGLRGIPLQSGLCFTSSISDHEAVSADEVREKARLGITIALRDGSVGEELEKILAETNGDTSSFGDFGYSTDESDPARMVYQGYMDKKVRTAIEKGVKPELAIRAASFNMARFFRLDEEIGGIAPGKCADILLLEDLKKVVVRDVLINGEFAVRSGRYEKRLPVPEYGPELLHSVHLNPITEDMIAVKAPFDREVDVRVIGMNGDPLITDPLTFPMKPVNGRLAADPERDIAKIVTIDRHLSSGRVGVGFIHGFGFTGGAIGQTCNPCSENLNLIGTNDADIVTAANYLIGRQGGYVVVRNGKVIAALDLPIGGMCSPLPYDKVAEGMRAVEDAAKKIGCKLDGAFYKLAFMVYPTQFPSYKLSTYGLVEVRVDGEKQIPLFADGEEK